MPTDREMAELLDGVKNGEVINLLRMVSCVLLGFSGRVLTKV